MNTKTKKTVALLMCAVMLVAASVLATMAYLQDSDEVVNTFTVGKVEITLDEADVDENGVPIKDAARVHDNEYKLMPGHTYVKDPTVHVEAGSEDSYIRMLVTIENYQTLQDKLNRTFLPEEFVEWNSAYWTCEKYVMNGDHAVLEFRHNDIIKASDDIPALFTKFTLPSEIEDMAGLDDLKINVRAEAIQAEGFADADAAFDALNEAK